MRSLFKFAFVLFLALALFTDNSNAQGTGFGLVVDKDGTPTVNAGGFMNYTLVIQNNDNFLGCNTFGEDVILIDDLPDTFTATSITATKYTTVTEETLDCDTSDIGVDNILECDLGSFNQFIGFFPLSTYVIVQISGTAPAVLGDITNEAEVFCDGFGPTGDTTDFTTTVVAPGGPQPDLVISKADVTDPVVAGSTAFYNLTVFNAGTAPANNVIIRDILPPGTSYNDALSSPTCFETPNNRVSCPVATPINPGTFRIRTIAVDISAAFDEPSVIQNIARVFSLNEPDSDESNNITFEPTQIVPPAPNTTVSDLVVTKTSPDTVVVDQEFDYVVNIYNAGPDTADNVMFTDSPFMGTTIDIGNIIISNPPGLATCMFTVDNNFTCDIPDSIPAGQSVSFIIPATYPMGAPLPLAPGPTPIFNAATATLGDSDTDDTDQVDPAPSNNTFVQITNVVPPGLPEREVDLVLTKTSPGNVVLDPPGGPFEPYKYVIDVLVGGPDNAESLRIRDTYPTNIDVGNFEVFVNGLPTADTCMDFADDNFFRCDLAGVFEQGDQIRIQYDATYVGLPLPPLPYEPFPIFNHAQALLFNDPDDPLDFIWIDPTPENNIDVAITNIFNPVIEPEVADLVLTKSMPDIIIPGTLAPTNTFGISIEVANLGPNTARDVTITDIIPEDVTILTFEPDDGTCNEVNNIVSMRPEIICDVGDIEPGQIARVDFRAVYTGPAPQFPNFRAVFNLATATLGLVRPPQIDPDPTNNTDVEFGRALIPQNIVLADLDVRKSAPVVIIDTEIDQPFSYFLQVTNLGPGEAQNVMLRDIIPADIAINEGTLPAGCAVSMGEIECDIGTLTNGQTVNLEFEATYTGIAPPLPDSVPVFNLAKVFFDPAIIEGDPIPDTILLDLEPANNTASAITRVIAEPPSINLVDLFVVKVDSPDPVVSEGLLTYTLFVYNFGPEDAEDVILTDILPEGVEFVSADNCNEPMGQVITCNIDLIEEGTVAIRQIRVNAPEVAIDEDPIMIINAARADVNPFALLIEENTLQLDFAPSNNTDYEKTTVVPVPPPVSDLSIDKADTPDPVIEGNILTYTIFVKNGGPNDAYGVRIYDWLPTEGLVLDTVEFVTTSGADCMQDPMGAGLNVVQCDINLLPADTSATITISVEVDELPPGLEFLTMFNLAKVESVGTEEERASADPNPLNNVVIESTLIGEFVPVADLFIIKSDSPDPVIAGNNLTYTLFVSNAGPNTATNVIVTDTLPAGVNFISATPDQGNCGGPVGGVVTCNLGTLTEGAFTQVRIRVTPQFPGTLLNVAQVAGDQHDPSLSNNISPQTTTVVPGNVPPPEPPEPGGNDLFILK
ncbi:MAG: DUF11 domain-containing protein, partial [Thermodesulfobacteriota bacterium]